MTMLEAQEEAEAWAEVERERDERAAEIARLRAALKPFADLARTYKVETGEFNRPDDKPVFGLNDAKITVGHLRAAMKTMEGK